MDCFSGLNAEAHSRFWTGIETISSKTALDWAGNQKKLMKSEKSENREIVEDERRNPLPSSSKKTFAELEPGSSER